MKALIHSVEFSSTDGLPHMGKFDTNNELVIRQPGEVIRAILKTKDDGIEVEFTYTANAELLSFTLEGRVVGEHAERLKYVGALAQFSYYCVCRNKDEY